MLTLYWIVVVIFLLVLLDKQPRQWPLAVLCSLLWPLAVLIFFFMLWYVHYQTNKPPL